MNNPNGPYPGRQLFIGNNGNGNPSFVYLVTGRSMGSRERIATRMENKIIMGPIGNQAYDPLRHYSAVAYDSNSGIIVISNGIHEFIITQFLLCVYRIVLPA